MATFTFFDEFGRNMGQAVHNFDSHTLKVAFSNTAPDQAANAVLADITQIASGGGYTAGAGGGVQLDSVVWEEAAAGSGTWRLLVADEVFNAVGADVGPFRYMVLYNDTPTSPADPLIGYVDLTTPVTVPSGASFTIDLGANGFFTLPIT